MLDEKDLQAIAQLMDSKMTQQKQEIIGTVKDMMTEQKREIISETMVLMESYFDPKFQALSEQINPVPKEAVDIIEDRVDDLEKAVDLHTQQIKELKKAQ
mgnify:FL=1|nr:MAG TPA: hypothetical protein [Caudoviricetes sp.]